MSQPINVQLLNFLHRIWTERILTLKYLIIDGLLLVSLERILAKEHSIANHPQSPYIDLIPVTYRFALAVLFDHLWRHIIGGPTNGKPAFLLLDLGSKAKIPDLQTETIA